MQEIKDYLNTEICVTAKTNPLVWWREHRLQYLRVAMAARKWLSVSAISMPIERVFLREEYQ